MKVVVFYLDLSHAIWLAPSPLIDSFVTYPSRRIYRKLGHSHAFSNMYRGYSNPCFSFIPKSFTNDSAYSFRLLSHTISEVLTILSYAFKWAA